MGFFNCRPLNFSVLKSHSDQFPRGSICVPCLAATIWGAGRRLLPGPQLQALQFPSLPLVLSLEASAQSVVFPAEMVCLCFSDNKPSGWNWEGAVSRLHKQRRGFLRPFPKQASRQSPSFQFPSFTLTSTCNSCSHF